ncbi:MAG TPA: hypothetical protein VLB29_19865 [Nocardioidaceae bacterium]|nr:hypothetical protein [Nocardioidaceae bacterium]
MVDKKRHPFFYWVVCPLGVIMALVALASRINLGGFQISGAQTFLLLGLLFASLVLLAVLERRR